MKEKFESAKEEFRQELDELKVQLSLGKADAADYFEKKKEDFSSLVGKTKETLNEFGAGPEEKVAVAQQKLDELKVQLALGKMETSDSYQEQKEKLHSAIDAARERVATLEDSSGEQFQKAQHAFDKGAEAFKTQLEVLAVNLGASAIVAREEFSETCDKLIEKVCQAASFAEKEIHDARVSLEKRIHHREDS